MEIEPLAVTAFSNMVAPLCRYEEFREKALSNKSTLFIVVADECHWGITHGGSARIYPKPTPKFLAVFSPIARAFTLGLTLTQTGP